MTFEHFISQHLVINQKLIAMFKERYPNHIPYDIKSQIDVSIPNPVRPGTVFTISNINVLLDEGNQITGLNCMCTDVTGRTVWFVVTNPAVFRVESVTIQ